MIKAMGFRGKHKLTTFGLSAENITRLIADEPIHFSGHLLGIEGDVLIFYKKNTKELESVIKELYDEKETRIG